MASLVDLYYGPRFPFVPSAGPVPASMVGSIVLASEVSLLLLLPTSMTPTQIKCAKDILRYPSSAFDLVPQQRHPSSLAATLLSRNSKNETGNKWNKEQ
jgi:hypothetical protein